MSEPPSSSPGQWPRWFALPDTGVYEERQADGTATRRYRRRFRLGPGRWTWNVLKATTRREAIAEAVERKTTPTANAFAGVLKLWQEAGSPGHNGRARTPNKDQLRAVKFLAKYWSKHKLTEIAPDTWPEYASWRRRFCKRGAGGRTVDLDRAVMSNILDFAVRPLKKLQYNPIARGCLKYQGKPRHAREIMPESAEDIHALAQYFLASRKSEVMAWLAFFSEFTGCRKSELLRLDLNSKNTREPGFIEWLSAQEIAEREDDVVGHLYLGRRSKNGLNPWARIGPEFAEMIKAFLNWHKQRFGLATRGKHNWFFHGRDKQELVQPDSFGHALCRATAALKLHHITPHGFRAFYATKRLRDGARREDVAAEIGDRTVELVSHIYADNPDGKRLWWTPPDGTPAWTAWLPAAPSRSQLCSQSGRAQKKSSPRENSGK